MLFFYQNNIIAYYKLGDYVKIESNLDDCYTIFINNACLKDINYNDKEKIGTYLKDVLLSLKKRYNVTLHGFYDAEVYINNQVGMFIELIKDNKYSFDIEEIDLKIKVYFDCDFCYKTSNYDIIKDCKNIQLIEDEFYINLKDYNQDIINIIEFGNIINKK